MNHLKHSPQEALTARGPAALTGPVELTEGDLSLSGALGMMTQLPDRKVDRTWESLLSIAEMLDAAGWCVALATEGQPLWLSESARRELEKSGPVPGSWLALCPRLEELPAECQLLSLDGLRVWSPAPPPVCEPPPATNPLTRRESEVLRWVRDGKTAAEMALILGCTARTIEKHIQSIYRKLGVTTRAAAILHSDHRRTCE